MPTCTVIPLPLKQLRNWVLFGNYALVGAAFAKLFKCSPSLARRYFKSLCGDIAFINETELEVANPEFQAFLLGYRKQFQQLKMPQRYQEPKLQEDVLIGFYALSSLDVTTEFDQLDHWQQIRQLISGLTISRKASNKSRLAISPIDRRALERSDSVVILFWPRHRAKLT